jgi:hypothetical protein
MPASLTGLLACGKSSLVDYVRFPLIRNGLATHKNFPLMVIYARTHAYPGCSIFLYVAVLLLVLPLTLCSLNGWGCFASILPCWRRTGNSDA